MKWNQIEPTKDIEKIQDKDFLKQFLLIAKRTKKNLESKKEIFEAIFFPVQLVIWTLDDLTIAGADVKGTVMIFFTIAFMILINSMNKDIFKVELEIECTEKQLDQISST